MQVSYGKTAPLKRIKLGRGPIHYRPTLTLGGKRNCKPST